MINERIQAVLYPETAQGGFVVKTDRRSYELKMGGYRICHTRDASPQQIVHAFDSITVEAVYTDDDALFIELSDGSWLVHAFTEIDSDGNISASVQHLSPQQFTDRYGSDFQDDTDIRRLTTDGDGNSQLS